MVFLASQVAYVGSSFGGAFLSPIRYPIFPLPRIYILTNWEHRKKLSPFKRIVVIWTEWDLELEARVSLVFWGTEGEKVELVDISDIVKGARVANKSLGFLDQEALIPFKQREYLWGNFLYIDSRKNTSYTLSTYRNYKTLNQETKPILANNHNS